jgi:hypothetical protein
VHRYEYAVLIGLMIVVAVLIIAGLLAPDGADLCEGAVGDCP